MLNRENQLYGRVAIVTGATSGIGRALVIQLAANGIRCIAVGRREEKLRQLQEGLGSENVFILPLDLRDKNAATVISECLPENWPRPDILINNAGLALGTLPAQQCLLSDWETMIETNVTSLVKVTHALLPSLIETKRADIINMSSVAATHPYLGGNVYGATKAFVRQFSLGLRSDLLGTNVRVTSVEPGMCETEFSLVRFDGDDEKAAKVYQGMKPLSSDDVALTVVGVLELPHHVTVNTIELMPTQQAFGNFAVDRQIQ